MPASEDAEQSGPARKAGHEIVGQPRPNLVALRLRVGIFAALQWIIEHAQVETFSSHGTADRRVPEEARLAYELEDGAVAQGGRGPGVREIR